jgi:hypothetical protein
MQTFPPLCIHNFGLPRRTPSPCPPPTPHDFSTPVRSPCRAPALPTARVHGRRRTRPRLDDVRGHSTGTEVDLPSEEDGAELTRTTTATNDEHALGWAATGAKTWAGRQLAVTWPRRRLARTTYIKMARRKKYARARSVKKISEVGFTLWVCQV